MAGKLLVFSLSLLSMNLSSCGSTGRKEGEKKGGGTGEGRLEGGSKKERKL